MATEVLARRGAQASTGRFYDPGLDALRFFAFFSVFIHHGLNTNIWRIAVFGRMGSLLPIVKEAAGFGLPLFFFLSSYLITTLLFLEKKKTSTISLRSFYMRRILRIWPLYFLYLFAVYVVGMWVPLAHIGLRRMLSMSFLCSNWYFIVAGMGSIFISHLWSISVEEQFYLIWPGITKRLNKQGFLFFACIIGILSLAITYGLASTGANTLSLWLNTGVEGIFFASGAVLAITIPSALKKGILSSAILFCCGALVWLIAEVVGRVTVDGPVVSPLRITVGYFFISIGCYLFLIGALKFPENLIPRWLIYLGKISYGLYVFHAMFLIIVRDQWGETLMHFPGTSMLISIIFTVVVSVLSYEFIEKPFLLLKNRFAIVNSRPA